MSILAVLAIYLIIAPIEIVSLIKTNKRKELVLFSFIMLIAFTLSVLIAFDVKIPSINRMVGALA